MPITKTINLLPAVFQSDANQKFLAATLDQLVTEPNLIPINGYVGRKFTPGFKNISTYIREPDLPRADYQLEPAVVVKGKNTDEVDFHVTYPEVLQKINYYGGTTSNPNKLWSNEYYSYDPNIDLDKFINFSQYYWLPNGPEAVDIFAGTVDLEKTYFPRFDAGTKTYSVNGYGTLSNPDLVLARGGVYTFNVDQVGQNFWIQTDPGTSGVQLNNNNLSSRAVLGVANNGEDKGTVTFSVPLKTSQDFYVNMPVSQTIDLLTTLKYSDLQGQLLSEIINDHGGIDGQRNNLINKFMAFGTYSVVNADWTANSVLVPESQRYGVWKINLIPSGSDFIFDLVYYAAIPQNNKVRVQSGVDYGSTEWYTNVSGQLVQVPVISANLDTLYYQNGSSADGVGVIKLVDNNSNSINVTTDIIGKAGYVSPNGVIFTNGLKIKFDTSVTPASYHNNEYYVEGVGTAIALVAVSDLIVNFAGAKSNYDPTIGFVDMANASINAAKDQISIATSDNPSTTGLVKIGTFPNTVNPNYIIEQNLVFNYPYRAGQDVQGNHDSIALETETIGVTLPGVVINGISNSWYVPGSSNTVWHYDANQALINGQDNYGGAPTADGKYSYRDSTFITANAWGNVTGFTSAAGGYIHSDGHSKLIGFAADGYPIYGPFGYVNPADALSGTIKMRSSYASTADATGRPVAQTVTLTANAITTNTLTVSSTFGINPGMRVTVNSAGLTPATYWVINNGLSSAVGTPQFTGSPNQVQLNAPITAYAGNSITFEFLAGAFIEDYSYTPNSGTLDQYNGRYCVTPEFPKGTYAYFATQDITGAPVYPYFVGTAFFGSVSIDTNTSLTTPDYLMINRASQDKNPWSRRNRWFHKDVIAATSTYNNTAIILDQDFKAKRPIIEFVAGLQLYDFGINGLQPVDLLDTTIVNPFTQVEGVTGIFIDGISVTENMRIVFAADQNPATKSKIWVAKFIDVDGSSSTASVIHLVLADDGDVVTNDTVSVFNGSANVGKSFWYNGADWVEGQAKTSTNQAPLFDVFDQAGDSLGDISKYPIANNSLAFNGTKVFSYKLGTGTADSVLGFPLAYKNFNNVGDIQFENKFDTDTFLYTVDRVDYTDNINVGFLNKIEPDGTVTKLNCWKTVVEQSKQYRDISFIFDGLTNQFNIDVAPNDNTVAPNILVFVNYKQVPPSKYKIYTLPQDTRAVWIDPILIKENDKIDILVHSDTVGQTGYYEIPDNLNLNAQNLTIESPTLGEMRNHVSALTQQSLKFEGVFPGTSNLRDINIVAQGGTMLQHSAPTTFASMFLTSEEYGFVSSLQYAQQEYTRFKNKFLTLAANGAYVGLQSPVVAVDSIISKINEIKSETFPWYYSDMVPNGNNKKTLTYYVFDPAQRNYEITNVFDISELSNKAIIVYHNTTQLLVGRDYTFLTAAAGVSFNDNIVFAVNDRITIVEYHNTDGSYIPETPSKLGLYPKFTPEIFTDDTYLDPQTFIRGHDGSLTPVFNDYRDNLLLELEKRIYNNIKVSYSDDLVNIYDSKPGKFRTGNYSLSEFNQLVAKGYLPWTGFNRVNYNVNDTFLVDNAWTYNYGTAKDIVDGETLPGSWRACFEYFYDTRNPNTRPWEMLGFSEEPLWWQDTYGPAPYTSGNKILWDDLEAGRIVAGDRAGIDTRFARPGLSNFIPVNVNGEIQPPLGLLTTSYYQPDFNARWKVGQWSPVETAWRNSSEYPFAVQLICALAKPAKYFALGMATQKYKFNTTVDQYLITDTNQRITNSDVIINGYNDNGNITRSAGYLNWISDFQVGLGIQDRGLLLDFVKNYSLQLSYRMAGFSSKDNLKVLAEQNSPNSVNESVIIPDDNYSLVLNKSTPTSSPSYSAVIVEKTEAGFVISGYDSNNPFFTIVPPVSTGTTKTIKVLEQSVNYYTNFVSFKANISYGTEFTTFQQLATFLAGYERSLIAQGFRFDYFDADLGAIRDWQLSTKEFLFWAQQGWAAGSTIVLGPFADRIKLVSPMSAVDAVSNTFYGSKVINQNYMTLDSSTYTVQRDSNNTFRLSLDNTKGDMIAFASVNMVQYEHALIFDNRTQFNDVIYDPASGQRQFKLKLVGFKTGGWNGSLSADGFMYNSPTVPSWVTGTDYLKGDLVEYKNFYYAAKTDVGATVDFEFDSWFPVNKDNIKTGLINNFATNAGQSVDYYDTDLVNLESKFDTYSLGLIGYRNRNYLNDLGLSDTSQVKFYQGFIKQKGTRNAINALGKIAFNGQDSSVTINEDWAFRVGSYGSLETNQFVDLVLNEGYVLSNPTSLEVTSPLEVVYSSVYTESQGVFKTAATPWAPPFLMNRTAGSNYSEDIKSAGYVNIEDIDKTIFNLSNLGGISIADIGVGTTIWTANDYQQNWNAFRVCATPSSVIRISNNLNSRISVQTNVFHGLSVNDTVLMQDMGEFSGFYQVVQVTDLSNFIVAYKGDLNLTGFSNRTIENAPIYKLVSQRFTYASDIAAATPATGWKVGDMAWVDNNNTSGEWAAYQKSEPWDMVEPMPRSVFTANGKFGTSVKLSSDNNFAVVGEPGFINGVGSITNYVLSFDNTFTEDISVSSVAANTVGLGSSLDNGKDIVVSGAPGSASGKGYAFVYNRNYQGTISQLQILAPVTANAAAFGQSVAVSNDDQWLYVGAPGESAVYAYAYNSEVPSEIDTIAANGVASTFTLNYTPVATEVVSVRSTARDYVPFIDYTISGSDIIFTAPPASSSIAVRQSPGYVYMTKIQGPNVNSMFGYSISTTTEGRQLIVGAPETAVTVANVSLTNAGSVSVYDRSVDRYISGGQTLFGGLRTIKTVSKVYKGDELQVLGADYVIVTSTWVQFTVAPEAGVIVSIETDDFNLIETTSVEVPQKNSKFGYSVDICPNNCSIYIGAPYYSEGSNFEIGSAYRFVNQGRVYGTITGIVQNPTVTSGDTIRINDYVVELVVPTLAGVVAAINDANLPGITAANVDGYLSITSGSVAFADKLRILPSTGTALTDLGLDIFIQTERIANPTSISYDHFGYSIKIDSTATILGVGGPDATTVQETTFDIYKFVKSNTQAVYDSAYVNDAKGTTSENTTRFDAESTTFSDRVASGAVWMMCYLNDARSTADYPGVFNFVEQLTPNTLDFPLIPNVQFGASLDIRNYELLVGLPGDTSYERNGGRVYLFDNVDSLRGWDAIRRQEPKVDINCLIKSYVYDADSQTIIDNLDYIDPAKGKIIGVAEQDITYKTDYDPAVYNNATGVELSTSSTFFWNNSQVGQVWWDLSTVRYIDYEQGSIKYRTSNWGREFPGSSIDVYEWVESLYPPSQYVANGGSGTPKYADNSAYVTLSYVDPATNLTTVRYYFWVKDKATLTENQFGRETPTISIAGYIRNPISSGVKFFAALRDDSVAVYNVLGLPKGKSTILHIDYATKLNSSIIHSEYALLPETGVKSETIPENIYSKLVDSASGVDLFGNPVPDPKLPVQSRYGIDIRPRQSMFVNKNDAIEQMVSYVNAVFATNIISQGFDLSTLSSGEPVPLTNSGIYNLVVNSYEELGYVNIIVHPVGFKVLVTNDSTVSGLWTIYTKQANNIWKLTRVQSYRTTDYWEYVDWYAPGFDSSVLPTFTVDTFADMKKLKLKAQNIVKVLNNGQGKWTLVQVFPNITTTIGLESGTIALTQNLYKLDSYGMSFDTDNFDSRRFDQNPSLEIRKILEALRNDIFVNQLDQNFLDLFFVFVYYVLDEQKYVDWVFKTSFIDVLHKVKGLDQPQIYAKENQDYYRQYIEEVKPYHTTIREYVVDYEGVDNVNGYTTDFDLPSYFDGVLNMYRSPSGEFVQDTRALQEVQYSDWLSSYPYIIDTIEIASGGENYTAAPQVVITGSTIGNNAVARALISNGVVSKIEVLYGGSDYINQPVITLTGGNGTGARAYARLKNDVVRKLKTTLVYDRVTYGTSVLDWTPNTAYTQGSIVSYAGTAYVVDRSFTSGATFIGNDLTVYPAYNFNTANDRIQSYYDPESGLPGKNFGLLQVGVDYPGVTIEGPLFDEGGGFDVGGFDSSAFDALTLDEDGTFVISDSLLDTKITSSYTDTSLGLRPEDIIIDGGQYVDTYSSHAPEELVPGRVYDTLDLTVTTFATNAATTSYNDWVTTHAFEVVGVVVANAGAGYDAGSVQVTITGSTGNGATAQAVLDANGSVIGISVVTSGTQYTSIPTVTITGPNTSPATASVRLGQSNYGTFDYRMFKDMNDVVGYYRVDQGAMTTLAEDLTITANTIVVANSSVLATPNPVGGVPGVVFIGGERITYFAKNDTTNTLSQIRRSTAGTGAAAYPAGTVVTDVSTTQKVPLSDNTVYTFTVDTDLVASSGQFVQFKSNTAYVRSKLWYDTGVAPAELISEFAANTFANIVTTESSISITTDTGYSSPANGNGLYASSTVQSIFVRQA